MTKQVTIVGLQDAQGLTFATEDEAREYLLTNSHLTNVQQMIDQGIYSFQTVETKELDKTTVTLDGDSEAYKRLGNISPMDASAESHGEGVQHVHGLEETERQLPIPEQPAGVDVPKATAKSRAKVKPGEEGGMTMYPLKDETANVGDKPEVKK